MTDYTELTKRLRECTAEQNGEKTLWHQAADAIEELLQKTQQLHSWIPVKERLPEKNGSYLVYVYGEVTEMDCWHGKWHRLRDDYTKAVTHWMPLPKPPKEET